MRCASLSIDTGSGYATNQGSVPAVTFQACALRPHDVIHIGLMRLSCSMVIISVYAIGTGHAVIPSTFSAFVDGSGMLSTPSISKKIMILLLIITFLCFMMHSMAYRLKLIFLHLTCFFE